jgi:DNA replication protein DnaC
VLVLDDLGAERLTAWAAEQLDGIVGVRYDRGLPMIATSNFTPAQLAGAIAGSGHNDSQTQAQRIISRLTEDAQRIHFDTPDRRLTTNRNAP